MGGNQARPKHPVHSSAPVPTARKTVLRHRPHRPRPQIRTIHVAAGPTVKRFDVSAPAGAIKLLRITLLYGTRISLTGTIPSGGRGPLPAPHGTGRIRAIVAISTPRPRDPSETCRRLGGTDVCTQGEEACPMPPANWHFRLHKLAGPAGLIRLEFVVG
jgi:hypothetical protein